MRLLRPLLYCLVLVGFFVLGGLIGFKQLPPITNLIDLVETGERAVWAQRLEGADFLKWEYGHRVRDNEWIDEIHPDLHKTDVASLIDISSPEDVMRKRQALVDLIWPGQGLPTTRMPDEVIEGFDDPKFADLPNLSRIDRLVVRMPHGVVSNINLFWPERSAGQFVIYHQGHFGDFVLGKPVIAAALERGYGVVGMSMPMLGPNEGPDKQIPRFGYLDYNNHNVFSFLQTSTFNPMAYFVEPVVTVVNHLSAHAEGCPAITGISTGGWLASLTAALDSRICRTYPVAGSLPAYVRLAPPNVPNIGDYEEMRPELLAIANVLEVYVLAAGGTGRAHITIYNQFDNCCYRGVGALTFEEPVRNAVLRAGGGSSSVLIDSTHIGHRISEYATEFILDDLARVRGAR